MSQDLKTHDQQVNAESQQSETQQKKIDPVAQLKWLNSQQFDGGWGVFNNLPAGRQGEQPVQKFAKEEEEDIPAGAIAQEGLQLKSNEVVWPAERDAARMASTGTPTIQQKVIPINSDPALENEADVMGTKAAQGKLANVTGTGSGIQRQIEKETTTDDPENKHESYKSKAFKTTKDAPLSDLTEKDGKISINSIKAKEKKFKVNSKLVIPKGLKVSILGTDFSYEKSGKKYLKKEVARVKIVDDSNTEWNNKEAWTTRANVSLTEDENGLYKITVGDANVRENAVEVNGSRKTIPKDSELIITDYKQKSNTQIYLQVANKETNENYGWVNANAFGESIYNESFGLEKATYISEDENHSTINKKGTVIYKEENNYDYNKYLKEGDNYVLIPDKTKIKIISSDGNFSEVEGLDGTYYGWTSNGNYKKTDEADAFEIKDPDARLRVKQRKYASTGKKLNVGDFVITKGFAENYEYIKIAQTKKVDENYTEKADSDGFVLTENLTGKWANVKGKHAAWNKGRYTGQSDLIKIMGSGSEFESVTNELLSPYDNLVQAASKDGKSINLISGFRTYPEQKALYDVRHIRGVDTARPGYSQHQNGIAIDINTQSFSCNLYNWMKKNAPDYGFIRTVSSEHWHWEYRPTEAKKHGYKMPYINKG